MRPYRKKTPMTKTQIAKTIVKNVVGFSTSYTVTRALSNNVQSETPVRKTERFIGSTVVGLIVSDYAERWTDTIIDECIEQFQSVVNLVKK